MAKNHELWYTGEGRGRGRPREMPLRGKDSDQKHFIVAPGLQKGTNMADHALAYFTEELLGFVPYRYCRNCGGVAYLGTVKEPRPIAFNGLPEGAVRLYASARTYYGREVGVVAFFAYKNKVVHIDPIPLPSSRAPMCACKDKETHND